jgi:betaine-aldehyde dehydrogenase
MTSQSLTERAASTFIDGAWRKAGGPPIDVVDPSTGSTFAHIAAASPADVAAAAEAAARTFSSWRLTSGADRAAYLRAIARGVEARRLELEALQMRNSGKPPREAEIDVSDAVATFDYYAELAADLDARQGIDVPLPDPAFAGKTRFEPVGPVGMIVPWNFPLVTSAWKIAPALAAGCTVVLKTSEFTPLIELAYGDIAEEAGLPAGVLNLITGAAETGMALTGDARFHKLSFTGSNAVGSRVMAVAAGRCLPISLELGGKSPIVVLADADVELAVDCIMGGIFFNCGQMCSATSRLIVEARAAPAILDRLVERTRALVVAAPTNPKAEMGPITTRAQFDRILCMYERARADGLDCLTGGAGGLRDGGFFVEPTIWADVPRDIRSGGPRSLGRRWPCARSRRSRRRWSWPTTANMAWSPRSSAATPPAPSASPRASMPGTSGSIRARSSFPTPPGAASRPAASAASSARGASAPISASST